MFKKMMIGAGALLVLAVVVLGPAAFTHVKQAFGWVREEINDSVPIEYQLEQAEATIDEIIPEIEACSRVVAKEQVEIRYLEEDISRLTEGQAVDAERIQKTNAALKSGQVVRIANRPYAPAAVERELRLALRKHQHNAALLESKRRLLDARQRSLVAAQQKLAAVRAEKENLEIAVEQLRAQLRETEAMEATASRFHLDATKLAEVKELLGRVRKRLDIAQQLIENEAGAVIELPEIETDTSNITVEIDRYFGGSDQATVREPLPTGTASESN